MKLSEVRIENKIEIQKKPEIQEIEKPNRREHTLSFLAGCMVGEELYFSSWSDKGFYKMDVHTGISTFLGMFAQEKESTQLFERAIYYKNAIWMTPAVWGEHIVKVDLDTLEMTYLSLPESGREIFDKNGVHYTKFKCCYKENASELWLVPIGFTALLKVDMESETVEEIHSLEQYIEFQEGFINFSDACFVGDEIWICPFESDKLVVLDTIRLQFHISEWKNKGNDYRIVRNYQNWAVFVPLGARKNIRMIEKNTYQEKEIMVDATWEEERSLMHLAVHIIDQTILFAPFFAHEFLSVDLETGETQTDKSLHEYAQSMSWGPERYQTEIQYGSKIIYLSDMPDVPMMVYDLEKNMVYYIEKILKQDSYHKFLMTLYENNKTGFIQQMGIQERRFFDETEFPFRLYFRILEESKNGGETDRNDGKKEKGVGEKILSEIK
ncbi:hypothetical protein VSQ48_08355 [Candidatus Ventrimonas sp. KK005]|nr:hypothetical protein [Clostridiaceae bacterium]